MIFNLLVLFMLVIVIVYNVIWTIIVDILLELGLVLIDCSCWFKIIRLRRWTKTVSFRFVIWSMIDFLTILIGDWLLPRGWFWLVVAISWMSLLGVQAVWGTLHHSALSMFFKRSTLIVLLREN
jgi:hypothetical protein